MKFTVGGSPIELTLAQVAHRLRGQEPEPIRKYLVEVGGTVYPPKQVFAIATGRDRSTFTTYEATRVLSRLGLVCRRAGKMPDGQPAWVTTGDETDDDRVDPQMVEEIRSRLAVLNMAVASLNDRVAELEDRATA